jgi:hypothetical protein
MSDETSTIQNTHSVLKIIRHNQAVISPLTNLKIDTNGQ